jgi:CheY-like chemotaxis protein
MSNRRAVVLVVEDEPLVRFGAMDALQDAGFEVVEAGNADAALAVLSTRDDITVLFTDINMPGSMNGLELAGEVHKPGLTSPSDERVVGDPIRFPGLAAVGGKRLLEMAMVGRDASPNIAH